MATVSGAAQGKPVHREPLTTYNKNITPLQQTRYLACWRTCGETPFGAFSACFWRPIKVVCSVPRMGPHTIEPITTLRLDTGWFLREALGDRQRSGTAHGTSA
jgi:hypothetical protein